MPTSDDEVLKLLKDKNPEKTASIDNLSSRFLKDGAVVLALLISKLCYLCNVRFWVWEVHGFNINWLTQSLWHNRSWNTS